MSASSQSRLFCSPKTIRQSLLTAIRRKLKILYNIYIEFFYRHSIFEMLMWGVLLTAFWACISIPMNKHVRVWSLVNLMVWASTSLFIIKWTLLRSSHKQDISLIPFYSFIAARNSPELYRSVAANFVLFIPFFLKLFILSV